MKKNLIILVICAMMTGMNAYASDFNYTSDSEDNISITGQSQPGGRVSARVIFLGDSNEPIEITREMLKENPSLLNYIDQANAGEDGGFKIDFQIEGERGYYMIHLQDEIKDLGYEILFHFTEEDVKEAVRTLTEYAKTKSEEETIAYLDKNHLVCRITDGEYEFLKNGNYIETLIKVLKGADSVDGAEGLRACIDQSVFLRDFYASSGVEQKQKLIIENEGLLNLENFNNYKLLFNQVYSDSERQKILDKFSQTEYYIIDEFVKEFDIQIVLGGVEYAKWTSVQRIVDGNAAVFNSSDYNKYKDLANDKNTKAADIIKEITGVRFSSLEELSKAFSDAVDKYYSSGNGNGGSGGGGNGGGGGGPTGGTQINIPARPSEDRNVNDNPSKETDADRKKVFQDLDLVPWAEDSIEKLAAAGIISGKAEGIFAPNDNVTREEFLTMLIKGMGIEFTDGNVKFIDVAADAWYTPYVITAFENGIVSGISETEFGTGRNITRQDMAVMAVRAAEYADILLKAEFQKSAFKDFESISEYAKESVKILYDLEVISGMGDGRFMPVNKCTRAEAAVIIDRLISLV